MNRLSLTSTLTFRTTVVQNKYFLSVLSDCSKKKPPVTFISLYVLLGVLSLSKWRKILQVSLEISSLSHHTLSGQTVGFVTVTVFPSARITSESAPNTGRDEEKKSTRGSGKQVGCVEGKGTLCFSRIQESGTNSNICTISCNLVQPSVRLWR